MVTINNEDLRDVYHYLATIENVIQKEVKQINGNKFHLDKIVPDQLSKVYSQKEKTALAFANQITRTSYESSVVSLVSTFERVVFAKYKTTYGTLKAVVKDISPNPPMDYYKSREDFLNGNIDKLSGIIYLIDGQISNELIQKLKLLKDHRNYIAHGKRDVAPPAFEMKLADIAKTLDEVIREIEG
jgi:hypothetical protein